MPLFLSSVSVAGLCLLCPVSERIVLCLSEMSGLIFYLLPVASNSASVLWGNSALSLKPLISNLPLWPCVTAKRVGDISSSQQHLSTGAKPQPVACTQNWQTVPRECCQFTSERSSLWTFSLSSSHYFYSSLILWNHIYSFFLTWVQREDSLAESRHIFLEAKCWISRSRDATYCVPQVTFPCIGEVCCLS